ncbi:DNA adenine methylase [Rathayibacter sp. AY1C7]|uniref:DNA adenine methylase n=1 Tax=Rathayibacter sp. AY1C7 TaxID=2080540 RepID=UPI0015E3C40C|nr:DNA adenine methylase [Rathayibacter sp. AY1C7]
MGVRYIGSKARVAEQIVELAGTASTAGRFVDAFSGSGAVAGAAAKRGWAVSVNDSLPSAVAMSVSNVVRKDNVPFERLGGYNRAIQALNEQREAPGFIYREYSPASLEHGVVERRYFTQTNAGRLDSMRSLIATWVASGSLSWLEEQLLLSDLLQSANSVANISGTYGSFLKFWSPSALKPVLVTARSLQTGFADVTATTKDVFDLVSNSTDTVYLDPPYTKRQYSAYYHILETLHAGDAPEVGGVTGLRPWQDKASIFCYKQKALSALTQLISGLNARQILLSYSDEGHVPRSQLVEALGMIGKVRVHEIESIGRYRPNARASAAGKLVQEFVIEIEPTRERASINAQLPMMVTN